MEENKALNSAYIDDLTGLRNYKGLIHDYKDSALEHFHFIYIDIDDFNKMTMVFGVDTVDDMLVKLAQVLVNYCGKSDVYRVGNDQFLIITHSHFLCEPTGLHHILKQPYKHHNVQYIINTSVVVADHDDFEEDSLTDMIKLLRMTADLHKYDGKNTLIYTNQAHKQRYLDIIEVEENIHDAMDNNQFFPKYRPFVDTFSHEIVGFEAVSRWRLNGRVLKPNRFLELAQWTGKIYDIECYIFEEALKFYKELKDNKDIKLSDRFKAGVNLSSYTLRVIEIDDIIQLLRKYDVPAKDVIVEIKESMITDKKVYHKVQNLYELGFVVVLDDYSNTNSSLSYLADLKVDVLKLSESLLTDINESEEYKMMHSIYSFFVQFSKNFDLSVVSTGVSSKEDLKLIRELDIPIATGDYFSRAVVKEEFVAFLKSLKKRKARF
ncbi:MAG: EAL domain-containing protein [Candidatus Izimaplasma sp.]|nr:EAL domain-containing protein [Candidatus Izimaplasma bacterium]